MIVVMKVLVNWESGRSFDQNDAHFGRMTRFKCLFIGTMGGGVVNEEVEGCFVEASVVNAV